MDAKFREELEIRRNRTRRRIEMGYEEGQILANGAVSIGRSKSGYTPLSTRELVKRVTARMDSWEKTYGERRCHINNRHQLQIRGKHLRRLLKAMPNVRQHGSCLVEIA